MSQIGSTYARRWPISWGPRLRLALVAGVLLATMGAAGSSWVPQSVNGTPNDVKVWAPGVFSVATSTGAYLFQADGGVVTLPAPPGYPGVGTRLTKTGCFAGFFKNRSIGLASNCPPNLGGSTFPDGTTEVSGVKIAESGAGYALGYDSDILGTLLAFSATEGSMWGGDANVGASNPVSLGVMTLGGVEHALVSVSGSEPLLHWFADGASRGGPYSLPNTPPYNVQSIDLFHAGSSNPTAIFGFAGKLYRGTLSSGMGFPFTELPLPTPAKQVVAVDVNTDAGSVYGDGFGMALVQHDDDSVSLLSAVPAGQAQDIGTQWRVNSRFASGVALPASLSCQGAQTCVIASKQGPPGNLLVYTNLFPPTITADTEVSLPEGTALPIPFPVRASDEDGDAVRVSVNGGQPSVLSINPTEVNGGLNLDVSAGPVCATTQVPVVIAASDGWQAHDRFHTVNFNVIHTSQAGPPKVDIQPRDFALAGSGESLTITAASPPDAPCALSGFSWSTLTPDAGPLENNGGSTAIFHSPRVLCEQYGASYHYRVVGLDDAGVASVPTEFAIQVLPWGLPEEPFLNGKVETLTAGSSIELKPDAVHQCAPAEGFPGVDTVWELTDGGALPSTVHLMTADGGVASPPSVVTPSLRVVADECSTAAQLTLEVRHHMRDGFGLVGPPSTVQVAVASGQVPIESASLEVTVKQPAMPNFVEGTTKSNLNCMEKRGAVKVHIRLTEPDGTLVKEGDFSLNQPWSLPIHAVCGGQSLLVAAQMVEPPGPSSEPKDVSVPEAPVRLGPLDSDELVVTCGSPARGTFTQPLPEAPCDQLPLKWEQVDGPDLVNRTGNEQSFELIIPQETEFGDLIGKMVTMKVTAGSRDKEARNQPILLTAMPFINTDRLIENAVGADTDLIGVSVDLHNQTDCVVRSVDQAEHLVGADYVPDSARFNGDPIEKERITVAGEWVTFQGLQLDPSTTARLTYVVRPQLLGKTKIDGESKVRDLTVSVPVHVPVSECGCEGGGSGFAALGLAGLAAVLRRRRAR